MTVISDIAGQIVRLSLSNTGVQGSSGFNNIKITAGEDLTAFKAVYALATEAFYADKDSIVSVNNFLGITANAASEGDTATIITSGILENSSWAWDLEDDTRLFLGDDGAIAQGAPNTAQALIHIGFALSATKILIRISEPILLEDLTMLTQQVVAGEALTAGNLINIYSSASVPKARKANNTNGREAVGYVLEDVAQNDMATVYLNGKITGLSGLTIGATQYLGTSGAATATAPTASGSTLQEIGTALSATEIIFVPLTPILIS